MREKEDILKDVGVNWSSTALALIEVLVDIRDELVQMNLSAAERREGHDG